MARIQLVDPQPSPPAIVNAGDRAGDPALAFDSEDDLIVAPEGGLRRSARGWLRHVRRTHLPDRVIRRTWAWLQPSRTNRLVGLVGAGVFVVIAGPFVVAPPKRDIGWVMIASTPAGAPVWIDGVLRGPSPFGTSLPAGKHQVDVGRDPVRSQTIYVTANGDTSVHIELPPRPDPATLVETGGLQITTQPAHGQIWIDGQLRGAAPITVSGLTPGPHDVLVKGAQGSMNRRVTVEKGTVAALILSMTSTGGYASGWLTVTSPVSAEIRERGVLLGTTDTPRILIPAGEHRLEISNPAFGYRVERTVRITAGRSQALALEAPRGTVHVNAMPWAEVWIDGRRVGDTPIGNISLPIGHHELVLRHPELGEQRQTIAVGMAGPVRVGVDLRK